MLMDMIVAGKASGFWFRSKPRLLQLLMVEAREC